MKNLLIITVMLAVMAQSIIQKDKAMHFAVGYVAAHTSKSVILQYTDNKKVIKYGPVVICIALGITKELIDKYDSNPRSTFEWEDIAFTTGGGITLLSIDIGKK
jgi:uncharacterized membrane protein YjdF